MPASQERLSLSDTVQQHAPADASSLVSLQIEEFVAAGSFSAEKDLALCNADDAAFDLTLPPVYAAVVGKPYVVRESGGTNAVTVVTPGAEEIDGGADFEVAAGTSACFVFDGANWFSIANAGSGGAGFIPDAAGSVVLANMAAESVDSAQYVDGSIDPEHLAANAVDSPAIAAGAVDEIHLSVTRTRSVAADGALVLAATDAFISLAGTTTGTKAATMTANNNGSAIRVVLVAASGGSYTLAAQRPAGSAGTVTLDAAGEGVMLIRVGGAWIAMELIGGATFA